MADQVFGQNTQTGDSGHNYLVVNDDGSINLGYDSDNPLNVREQSFVDTGNSTSTSLLADAPFVGVPFEITQYGAISIAVYSDVASATDGLMIEQSVDGVSDWHWVDYYTIPADTGKSYQVQPSGDFLRITYTNGALDQTDFHLHVVVHPDYIKPSSHRIQDAIVDEDDAELVKAVLTGEDVIGGVFRNALVTPDGNLQISDNSNGLAIAKGEVIGSTFIHKFGAAPDFDTTDGEVVIWDAADDGNENLMTYTYSATADIDRLSSSSAADTTDIEVQGLDTNYATVTQTITLTGQTPVALTTPLLRVVRLTNVGSADVVGRVYCFVNGTTTAGVPDALIDTRAVIDNGNNQTEMAVYTVPAGKTAYMRDWYASSAGARKTTNLIIKVKARPLGQVFQLKHKMAFTGDAPYQHDYKEPEVFVEKTDIEMTVELAALGVTGASVSAGFDLVLVDN